MGLIYQLGKKHGFEITENASHFKILCTQSALFEDEDGVIWPYSEKLA